MEQKITGRSAYIPALIVYSLLLYAAWAVMELVLDPMLKGSLGEGVLYAFLKDGVIKNIVWTLPAVLLVRQFDGEVLVRLCDILNVRVKWLHYLPVFAFLIVWAIANPLLSGGLKINEDFGWNSIIVTLFVGITEEMVFRGWLLNITAAKWNQWVAVAVNAVLFILIHFPCWIADGRFVPIMTSFSFVTIAILGTIFSVSFLKSKSLLVPIAMHMLWDLLGFMIF